MSQHFYCKAEAKARGPVTPGCCQANSKLKLTLRKEAKLPVCEDQIKPAENEVSLHVLSITPTVCVEMNIRAVVFYFIYH